VSETPDQIVVPEGAATIDVVEVRRGAFGASGSGDTSGFGGLIKQVTLPAPASRPYGEWFDDLADELEASMDAAGIARSSIRSVVVDRGEITFMVERENFREVAQTLRDEPGLRFEFLSSLSGVHWPGDAGRELHVAVHLQSITHNRRIRLETTAPDADPHVPSLVPVYPTADWHERETYDFFGIIFDDHPGLTRIMMPDDWPGHPQRKDYPLGGIPVQYKGATIPPPDERRSYS